MIEQKNTISEDNQSLSMPIKRKIDPRIVIIGGGVVLAIILGIVVFNLATRITVPDVRNLSAEGATQKLVKSGFDRSDIAYDLNGTEKSSLDYKAGDYKVEEQSVKANSKIRSSDGIVLYVIDLAAQAERELYKCDGMSLDKAMDVANGLKFVVSIENKKEKRINVKKKEEDKWQVINVYADGLEKQVTFKVDTIANIKKEEEEAKKKAAEEARKKEEAEKKKEEEERKEQAETQARLDVYDELKTTVGESAPKAVAIAKKNGYKVKIMDMQAIEKNAEMGEDVLQEDITESYYDESPTEGYTVDDYRNSLIVVETNVHATKKLALIYIEDNQDWLRKKYD